MNCSTIVLLLNLVVLDENSKEIIAASVEALLSDKIIAPIFFSIGWPDFRQSLRELSKLCSLLAFPHNFEFVHQIVGGEKFFEYAVNVHFNSLRHLIEQFISKVYNLKQMAAALQYLKEHQLFEYDDLAAKTDAATERFHTLAGDIQQTEAELSRVSDLMAAVVQYAKTRPAFDGYKAAKYSRKYLAEHEAELADYRAAKATMAELLGGEKLPKMDVLKEKRRQLAARKKALYLEYRKAQQDMRELVAVKGSVDHLRGLTDNQRNKEQAR